jgi:GntR family transcriptional regulator
MFIILSGSNGVPLYQQIVDQMRAKILSGELHPGEPLPSMRQLAADLMTSMITTKRAYQELEVAGLIQTRPGLGTYVRELPDGSAEEIKLNDVRQQLAKVLRHAERLGVSSNLLRQLFEEALQAEEDSHEE